MKYRHPLKQVLSQTRSHWDRDKTPSTVRWTFGKALQCQTAELGAEVYAGEDQELILYHTCKSRTCPSCGYRSNVQWLRERWAALPDGPYKGITFTCPMCFGLFSEIIRGWLRPSRLLPQTSYRHTCAHSMVYGLASLPFCTLSTED